MRLKFPENERPKILQASQRDLWSPAGESTLKYLREKRFIADEVIRQFQFGWCPVGEKHDLAGRIIMPLFDAFGELVVFTSRAPDAQKKYQHWHESFDKSNYLYGLNFAIPAIRKCNKAIVVEGQFDVACLHSYGFNMTVGILGSTFSIIQVSQLARYCSEIYLAFDPDESGRENLKRSHDLYRQYCLEVYGLKFFTVPITKDPDDYVVHDGPAALTQLMRTAKEKYAC